MKLFKTLALVGYGHSHFAQLDRLTSFGPENKLVEIGPSEHLNRSTRYPRRRGPPGTNVQSRPSSQIDDPRGAPGVAQAGFNQVFLIQRQWKFYVKFYENFFLIETRF